MPDQASAQALFSLEGHTALVTGASSGLGMRAVQTLAQAGAKVVGAARRLDLVNAQALRLREAGHDVRGLRMDVSDDASVTEAFAQLDAFGLCADIIVNYAGVSGSGKWRNNDEAHWMRLLQTNLLGTERVCQSAVSRMVRAGCGGSVINIASTLGITVQPGVSAYASGKAAVMHLTKTMAMELWPRGIRVNCLAPGLFNTAFTADFEQKHGGAYFELSLTRRMGEPAELDGALLFLASGASAYVNGVVLPVDGGNHLRGM